MKVGKRPTCIVKLTDCRLFSAFLHEAKPLKLLRAAFDNFQDFGVNPVNLTKPPALTRLMDDIDAGQVQVVVVYKVDRLTRALTDFAKMIERFNASATSFIAVTQQFNTTTSMGRLTLNVLLSFAQFEREVTGERIRDKIAASKQKGLWMGGYVPLGYDAKDRTLVINHKEAETVRYIFTHYRELGAVRALKAHLDAAGIVSKVRVNAGGHKTGGQSIARGALYTLLKNPLYIGQIVHKGTHYEGQHAPHHRCAYLGCGAPHTPNTDTTQKYLAAEKRKRRSSARLQSR